MAAARAGYRSDFIRALCSRRHSATHRAISFRGHDHLPCGYTTAAIGPLEARADHILGNAANRLRESRPVLQTRRPARTGRAALRL